MVDSILLRCMLASALRKCREEKEQRVRKRDLWVHHEEGASARV